ncbi:APC family permease [Nocardioides sp. YIM B13467]|uniref:APC family permease n=1 Tax=Nocardioides sp. YIM B13467 TaxID=3366294 RepID=UPI00366FFAFD
MTSNAAEQAPDDHEELSGLQQGTLSLPKALGLAVVTFSPVLMAATAPALAGVVAGPTAWLSVLAGTVLVTFIGLAIVPFARRYVVSGALYSYIGHELGSKASTVAGASLAVGYAAGVIVCLQVFGVYSGSFIATVFDLPAANGLGGQTIMWILAMVSVAWFAIRGLDTSTRLSIGLLFVSAPIVAIVLIANVFTAGYNFSEQFAFGEFTFSGFVFGIVLSATFFVGFESSAATALETKNPMRTIPRLMTMVPLIVGSVGIVATLLSVPVLPDIADATATGESPLSAMASNAGLGLLAPVADLFLAVTCYAVVLGFMNYAPRVWATMAVDGMLPKYLGHVDEKHRTPVRAIVLIAVLATIVPIALSAFSGGTPLEVYAHVATLFPYYWVIPYVLICVGAIVMMTRRRELSATTVVVAVIGGAGFGYVWLSAVLNPTGTSYDAMTWAAPITIALALLVVVPIRMKFNRRPVDVRPEVPTDRVD